MLRGIKNLVQGDTAIGWQSQIPVSGLLLLAITNFKRELLRGAVRAQLPPGLASEKRGLDTALQQVALGFRTT